MTQTAMVESVDTRLQLLRADYTGLNRTASRPVDTRAAVDGQEWVIVRDGLKVDGEKYARGARVKFDGATAEKLAGLNYITTIAKWEASQAAGVKRKFIQDSVFPVEATWRGAQRLEREAHERVTALEFQLIQARQAAEVASAQRDAVERQLSSLLDQAQ